MRENDEITGLFRSRLAGAEMTVREDFWEGLQRDLPSPVAAKGRRPLFLSPRFHRVAAAASVVYLYWELLLPLSGISLRKRKSRRPLHKWRP